MVVKGLSQKELESKAMEFRAQVRNSIVTALTAAFGFVIALFWRDAIQEGIDDILVSLNITGEAYLYKVVAALIVTVIAVIGIMVVNKWGKQKVEEETGQKEKAKE